MTIPEFTTLVGVDDRHAAELEVTWPGWRENRPELLERPMLFVCDAEAGREDWWRDRLRFVDHPNKKIAIWEPRELYGQCADQREIMLTALCYAPAACIETPWYLKLDTDTHADAKGDWLQSGWFEGDEVFTSHRWGYTKPARYIQLLDEWADEAPDLSDKPAPVEITSPLNKKQGHKRIISYVFFCKTDFTKYAMSLVGFPERYYLPVPSQDTFLWYVAARRGLPYRRVNMSAFGWSHHRVRK